MAHDERAPAGRPPVGLDPRPLDGRYRIGPQIARGGMASVHEALDLRLDRVVAVKIMHPTLSGGADGDFAARFVSEARAAARLSHPNVVAVYDQGEDDGTVFLAMELVEGHTLRDVVAREAPLSPGRALALMEPVLSALAAAHRAGLVHRDVKPENVLIADDGRIKVADFGLAKAVSSETQATTGGVLIGTVSYIAPELVIDGRSDARADVYAAGVVLYELLTGVKPHQGESPIAVAYKHVHHDVPPPSALVPGLPPYVDALVARATARDRSLRPADAGVLLHQLRRVRHALRDGVHDDPELTQDLTPVRRMPDPGADGADRGLGADSGREGDATWDTRPEAFVGYQHTRTLRVDGPPLPPPPDHPPPGADPTQARRRSRRPSRAATAPDLPSRPGRSERRRRSRRGPILLLVALLLAAGLGGGAYWWGVARYTTTPRVAHLDSDTARQRLQAAGLTVRFADPVYDAGVAKGRVVSADPTGGARILPGHTVTLTLSLGGDAVPRTLGRTRDLATTKLDRRQLEVGDVRRRWSDHVGAGKVIASAPAPGAAVEPGTAVDLVVSRGPLPISVRNWAGQPAERAEAALRRQQLVVTVTEAYDDQVAKGDVVQQDPYVGIVHHGDQVSLVVSRGPHLLAVPSVRGFGVDAATQTLQDAGFTVAVSKLPEYLGLGIAVRTDPDSGSMAPKGSTITLSVI